MVKVYGDKGRWSDIRISQGPDGCAASFTIAEHVGNETHDTPIHFTQRFASESIALDTARRAAANKVDNGYIKFIV